MRFERVSRLAGVASSKQKGVYVPVAENALHADCLLGVAGVHEGGASIAFHWHVASLSAL
jgi:hypothetical protein